MTTSFLLIVQIVLVVMLVIAVLLQKSSSIGLGAYSGSNESVFGAKGPASFLAKTTFAIGFLFVINTITLGYMYSSTATESIVDNLTPSTNIAAPSAVSIPTPAAETVVVTPTPVAETPVVAPVQEAAPVEPITQEQNNTSSTQQ